VTRRDPLARPHVRDIVALQRAGWRVVEIRPDIISDTAALWHTTIERRDGDVSITVTAADFDDGLEELVRYALAAAA
jgi:hypothetical protein